MLYRLVSQKISPAYWSHIFGGGARRSIRVEAAGPAAAHSPLAPQASGETNASDDAAAAAAGEGLLNTMTSITKQRVKLNIKVMHLGNV